MTLAEFSRRISSGVVDRHKFECMTRAVFVVEAQAKREAPVKTGNLRRSITSRVERGGDRGVIGTNANYARAVHDGSRPHLIRPKRAKALFWKGARHPVRIVNHPGSRGNPFFERALQTVRPRLQAELERWGDRMWSSV